MLSSVLSVFIILLGAVGLSRLPMEQFPEIAPPTVRLEYLYDNILKKTLPTRCGITCEEVTSTMANLNRLLTDSISCFSYILVVSGNAKVKYNDIPLSIEIGDMLITTPGTMLWTIEVSDDFLAMCLMCDEVTTYEIPFARNIIKASYFTGMKIADNKLSLTGCEPQWIERRMKEIYAYIDSDHIYKSECLQSLYSLFMAHSKKPVFG